MPRGRHQLELIGHHVAQLIDLAFSTPSARFENTTAILTHGRGQITLTAISFAAGRSAISYTLANHPDGIDLDCQNLTVLGRFSNIVADKVRHKFQPTIRQSISEGLGRRGYRVTINSAQIVGHLVVASIEKK